MISSPDLVAFTKETDFSEIVKDPSVLPEELSVPLYPYTGDTTPWSKTSGANFTKDFILLSEFSEQVGPQPLFTVPPETKACGTFDLNHFSLRIMSVDYQTSLTGPASCGSLKLNFVEDSKVVLGDSGEGAFAYVHHLTLYDLEARGFVRPLCLAYVSSDEHKIIQQFQQISAEFSKVSECLKTGNRKNFANELEIKLRDLEYTRVVLLSEIERELNNASVVCTNERERMLNGIPTLDVKLKEKSQSHKVEIKLQEKDRCDISRKAEVECEKGNRSCITHERDEQFGGRRKNKQDKGSRPMSNKGDELASVEKSIQDYKSLLKQVTCYRTRKLRDSEYSPYEPDDLPHSFEFDLDDLRHGQLAGPELECNVFPCTDTPSHSRKLMNSNSSCRFDKRLKTLEELCDDYFHQQALQQLNCIERTFRGDACHLYSQQLCHNLLRNLKSTNFLFEDPRDLEDDVGLQIGTAGQHSVRQPSFLPALSVLSEPVSLESYVSCVEMVPIKLELGGSSQSPDVPSSVNPPAKDNQPLTSSAVETEMENRGIVSDLNCQENVGMCVSALMKTSISSGDSIEVLGTEKSFRSQGSNILIDTALQRPPPLSTTAVLEGLRQGRVTTRRTCSEDSIEVLCTTESILPEDLRASYPCAIDEESPEQETNEKDPNQEDKQDKCVYCVGNEVVGDHGGSCMEEPQDFYPAVTLTPPDCPMPLTLGRSSSQDVCHASELIPLSLLDEPCRLVTDDLSDCFSYQSTTASTTSECTFPSCLPRNKREGGTRRRRGRVGRAALQFLRQFPFAVHAVFSLLSGRTLVVLGSEEAAVRRMVTALSVYMPHLSRYRDSIQPWTSMPLHLTDLLNWKLIGFNRMCCYTYTSMPHCLGHYSRYISILDVDQKTLCCPSYSGTLLNPLVEPRSHFKRGNTYFMFAQSVQSKLVTTAFLLTFSHGFHTPRRPWESTWTQCFQSEIHRDDKKILNYLSELIKLHFMEVPPNVLRFNYNTNSIFKL